MQEYIEKYQSFGLKPIPLKARDKLPKIKGWQTEDQTAKFADGDNIGCVLGNLVDIDCDWGAVSRYVYCLVPTGLVFGRQANPAAHFVVRSPGIKSFKFICPKSLHKRIALPQDHETCIVELRSGVSQTMFPGSIHPSGQEVKFLEYGGRVFSEEPAEITANDLRRLVAVAAIMTILGATWPDKGARHDAAGAVAGVMRKHCDIDQDGCGLLIGHLIQDGKEAKDRQRYIDDTYASPIDKISGWKRLQSVFGFEDDVIQTFKSWLGQPRSAPKSPGGAPDAGGFNDDHAIIREGGRVGIGIRHRDKVFNRETWSLMGENDFLLLYHKSTEARNWLQSGDRRTYCDGFVFDPSGKQYEHALNLWRGFALEPVEGEWKAIEYHIREVLAAGNSDYADYIIKWFAWLYQNPDKPGEVALVFKGGRGTGKGMLCRAIIGSLGQHGIQISSPSLMAGRFNSHLRDCIGLFADEAFWAGDKSGEGQLKRIITEPTLVVEAKHRDPVVVQNMLHIMIASNEDWIVPSGTDERRFAVFEVGDKHKQDHAYFDKLNSAVRGPEMQAFLHYCLNVDLKGWHPRDSVPRTGALQDQIELSERAEKAILRQILETGVLPGTHAADQFGAENVLLFPRFRREVRRHAFGGSVSDRQMGAALKKVADRTDNNGSLFLGMKNGEPRYKRVQQYLMPTLLEARLRFDPNATWPEGGKDWEFEFGRDMPLEPYQDDPDAPF